MGIKDFLERIRQKREKYSEFTEEQRMIEKFQERKKTSNERELERFMKEEREDNIKKELEEFRNKKKKDIELNHKILQTKNMFDKDEPELMRTPNMFSNSNGSPERRQLFFK